MEINLAKFFGSVSGTDFRCWHDPDELITAGYVRSLG
jgi:hypothetical protein